MNQDPFSSTVGLMNSLGLDTSPWALAAGLVFSAIGYYVIRAGRRRVNQGLIWSGVGMWVYPLFVTGALNVWLAGAALCGVAYYFDRRGEG